MSDRLILTATDEELRGFADRWMARLAAEDYAGAFEMLEPRPSHPGQSWCVDAADLRAWIEGDGTNEPASDEPAHKVSRIADTEGEPLPSQDILRGGRPHYPGFVARIDFWLPLDGEWSDLMASIDFVDIDGQLAAVLVALRVP